VGKNTTIAMSGIKSFFSPKSEDVTKLSQQPGSDAASVQNGTECTCLNSSSPTPFHPKPIMLTV
jgi:hypothetical protein